MGKKSRWRENGVEKRIRKGRRDGGRKMRKEGERIDRERLGKEYSKGGVGVPRNKR